jgi:DNA-binding beta-propeller fold protein YncE
VRDVKLLEHDIVCVLTWLFDATVECPFHQVANVQLNNPNGLAFDSKGNLWVANYGANQVLELDPSNGTVLKTITDYVKGPTRLAFDSLVNLWVANTTAGTVIGCRAKTFQRFFSYQGLGAKPLGVAVDAYGHTYIANNAKNDIVVLNVLF